MTEEEARERVIAAMCPGKVCRTCGEPSRRIVETSYQSLENPAKNNAEPRVMAAKGSAQQAGFHDNNPAGMAFGRATKHVTTLGWTDCGHDDFRAGVWLDPFA